MRLLRCWASETWQTAPTAVIPFALSPFTASSTFFCSTTRQDRTTKTPNQKDGGEKNREHANKLSRANESGRRGLCSARLDLLPRGDDDGGALQAETLGDGEADPLRGRRHDGHLPLQAPALDLHRRAGRASRSLAYPLRRCTVAAPRRSGNLLRFVQGCARRPVDEYVYTSNQIKKKTKTRRWKRGRTAGRGSGAYSIRFRL